MEPTPEDTPARSGNERSRPTPTPDLPRPTRPTPTAGLRDEGWTRRDLARGVGSGELVRIKRGIYAAPEKLTRGREHARLARVVASANPESVVSHTSAAVLHGLPFQRSSLGRVHVTRSGPGHGKATTHLVVHRATLADDEWEVRDGVRLTTLERTVADLARRAPYGWGVAAADAALRRQADPARLAAYVEAGRRVAGNGRLRAVLAFADARAESALESLSRVAMFQAGLPTPTLQFQVVNGDGEWVATSDFGWPDHQLVGEADGRLKYEVGARRGTSPTDVALAEKARDESIRQCGWWVTHWGWAEANDPAALATLLGRRLRGIA